LSKTIAMGPVKGYIYGKLILINKIIGEKKQVISLNPVAENIRRIRELIAQAAIKSHRNPEDITLMAVSKTVDVETARLAYEAGIKDFGENKVQELKKKAEVLREVNWHMIGRLQTNKVKDIVGHVYLIHSLDRWNLAEALEHRAALMNTEVQVLVQVNISGEVQKAGIKPSEINDFLFALERLKHIKVRGFMTMAPLVDDPEKTRPIFRELKKIYDFYLNNGPANLQLKYLSMGMSQDFQVAVEEGANIVRIGSAIFS